MRILLCALAGFLLDLLLGDPEWLTPYHPVVWMGKAISALEKRFRALFPKTARGEYRAGLLLVVVMAAGTYVLCKLVLGLLNHIFPPLALLLEVIWCWQALAVKDLRVEALRVRRALETEGLAAAPSPASSGARPQCSTRPGSAALRSRPWRRTSQTA